jgi:WD40 repeat protein
MLRGLFNQGDSKGCVWPCLAACLLLNACATTEEEKVTYRTPNRGAAAAAAWSPEGEYFAVGNYRNIWVYRTETLERVALISDPVADDPDRDYNPRHGWGNSLIFVGDEKIATSGLGATVTLWDIESGERLQAWHLTDAIGYAVSLSYAPDTNRLAVGPSRGLVTLLDPEGDAEKVYLTGASGIVHDLEFSADGAYLGAVTDKDELVIWEMSDFGIFDVLEVPERTMELERTAVLGTFLVAGEEVQIWRYVGENENTSLEEPNLVGQNTLWFVIDVLSYPWGILSASNEAVASCKRATAVSPDGTMIADMHPGTMKEVIRIIDTESGEEITRLNPRGGWTCDLVFSPDGKRLLIANYRGAHLADTETWKITRVKLK